MGKIKKVATSRHMATLSPFVKDFVQKAVETPLHQLPALLQTFPQHWPLPRGDLYHWIPLLDRFDHVLELFNKEYALIEGPQTQPFEQRLLKKGDAEEGSSYSTAGADSPAIEQAGFSAEGDRELVEAVLQFTRVLHEHCGNRSLYASSTHINDTLHTTSLSLLRACLQLGLRLAQRYQVARFKNHHPSSQAQLLATHYNISFESLQKIASPFPKPQQPISGIGATPSKAKDKNPQVSAFNVNDLNTIVKGPLPPAIRKELSSVSLSFYEQPIVTSSTSASTSTAPSSEASPATPTPVRRTSNLGPSRDRPSPGGRSVSTNDVAISREQGSSTPAEPRRIQLLPQNVAAAPSWSILKDTLPVTPADRRYELLNRVRIAKAFASPGDTVQQALEIRLLAIANLAYALNESRFQEKIGTPDAEEPKRFHVAQQLCDLLQPPTRGQESLSLHCKTTVLMALEALAKVRHKVSEVAEGLAITANHGILYYELRKVITSLGVEPHTDEMLELTESKWRDATFDLVNGLLQSNAQSRPGERMVSAGIMGILVEALSLRTARAERFYERVLQFFDSFIHNIPTALQTLANVKGLDIIADLTAHQVELALDCARSDKKMPQEYKSKVVDYDIPFSQQSTLRQLFKNTAHMFEHNSAGHDWLLRNLIDTPQILGALRSVIENATTFGSNVWSGAISIVSSFIHNEPTSYQVIGEAGLSKSLLESITGAKIPDELPDLGALVDTTETASMGTDGSGAPIFPSAAGILPVGEVMCDIPNAFGAICLNENGMQLFQASGVLNKYFDILLSPAHVRAMEDEGTTATTIGHSFDELSRHHPKLKEQIMSAVFSMLRRMRELTSILAANQAAGVKLWELKDNRLSIAGGSVALKSIPQATYDQALSGAEFLPTRETEAMYDSNTEDRHDRAPAIPYLSACFKFLEGFFHNNTMCSLFCEESGAEMLLDLAMSPSNPYDLVAFPLFSKVTQVLKTMCEAKPTLVLPSVLRRVQHATLALKELIRTDSRSSSFLSFTELSTSTPRSPFADGIDGTTVAKSLLNTHLLTHVLGRTLAPPPYTLRHGNQNNHLFTNLNFTDVYVDLITDLRRLHAACLWENQLLQRSMSEETKSLTEPRPFVMRRIDASGIVELASDRGDLSRANGTTERNSQAAPDTESRPALLAFKNTKAIRYLLSQVPMGIESFLHSLGQAIVTKRSEQNSKQHAIFIADQLAQALIWELDFRRNEPDDTVMETKYISQILTMIGRMLLRNSYSMEAFGTKEALTLVMTRFYLHGGFAKLNKYLARFVQLLVNQHASEKVEAPVKDAMQAILTFYGQIVRTKCIIDASQSSVIMVRDRTQPDYFQPGQFLVEVRDAVMPAISAIWKSKDIEKFSDANMRSVIEILRLILKSEGEDRALKRSERASRRVPAHKPEFALQRTDGVDKLVKSGFDRTLSREAMYRCGNSPQAVQTAESYCKLREKDARVPRFPIPEGETAQQTAPIGPSGSLAEGDTIDQAVQMDDADGRASMGDGNSRLVLSSDEVESDDDNFGSLGRIPSDMQDQDFAASLTDPASLELLRLSRPMLEAKDTQEPFTTVDDLDEKRDVLRQDLIDRCLDVLSTQPSLTFELADLIQAAVAKSGDGANPRADIGTTLVSSLMSLQAEEPSKELGLKIHAYAHLVALILQDRDFFDSTIVELKEYFDNLVSLVKVDQGAKLEDAPWVEMVLLIIERVLAEDEQPMEVGWEAPPADDPLRPMPAVSEPDPVVSSDVRSQLFEALVGLLVKVGKNGSLALSICRVLVVLTRRRELAARLADKNTMGSLFTMIRQLASSVDEKLQASFMLILRHVVEDDETIRQIMRAEVRLAFDNHRASRALDTTSYTRSMYHLAIRSPNTFVEVTQEMLEITRFDGNPHRAQQLSLKKIDGPQSQTQRTPVATTTTTATATVQAASEDQSQEDLKQTESKMPLVESSDGVVSFLLRQLSTYRDVEDAASAVAKQEAQTKPSTADSQLDIEMRDAGASDVEAGARLVVAKNEKPAFKPEEHTIYIYRCFVLQCLAELVACYNKTKLEFINFSRKSETQPATPSKPRAGTLNYILNVLLPVGTLEHRDDVVHRKKAATAYWATTLLVSLCMQTQERQAIASSAQNPAEFAAQGPELTLVRKFALEHALRSFKDATTSQEPLDQRYSRLLALGDLFNRMLNGKFDSQRSNVQAVSTYSAHQQIGRLMYEKSFIGTLTSAIAEMDLNFPNAKRAVKYILGPLKQLTELGVVLSSTSDLSTGPSTSADEDEISSATSISDDDDDDGEREQTPDLLRNTTLGDDEEDDSDEDEDDDDDDEEMGYDEDGYDEDMEYEEEEIMAEHGDVISDDDDDELGGMGEIEGVPGDGDMEIDIMMDEDEDDSGDSEEEDDEDEDADDNIEFGDHMDEITGDDENASMGEHDMGDWEEDGIDVNDENQGLYASIDVDDEHHGVYASASPHGGPLEHIGHVLGAGDHDDQDEQDHIVRIDMGQGEEEFFEDEMPPEDDDEDEEDEGEFAEDVVYEPEIEDDDDDEMDGGWAWDVQPPAVLRGGHPHHHHHHHRGLNEMLGMIGDPLRPTGIRSHRSTPNAREEDGVNPLLQREGTGGSRREQLVGAVARRPLLPHRGDAFLQDIVAAVGPTVNGPGIINVNVDPGAMPGLGGLPPVFTVQTRHGGHAMFDIDPSRPWREQMGAISDARRMGEFGRMHDRGRSTSEEAQAVDFRTTQTVTRWQEEARMLFPGKFHEKATRVINRLLRSLVPAAMEAKRVHEKKEAERRIAAEKEAEEARKRAEIEKKERAEQEQKEREEQEARERAAAEAAREQANQAEQAEQAELAEGHAQMEGVEHTAANDSSAQPAGEAESPQPAERITINIRGRELDITSLGIDREYIEALPEDMREEVIMTQFAEQRSQAVQQGEQPSEISREFLDALPREIQQELIRQEQHERRRREREEERQRRRAQEGEAQQLPQAEDMNNADFMAMLDPALRQAVLMDADDSVLAALPEDLQAEARALFGDRRAPGSGRLGRVLEAAGARAMRQEIGGATDDAAREPSRQRRPVAQMLDKAGIATLLRLMFVSLNHKAKTNLHGILSDVCKNTQNRAEVISILLSILQDGTADVTAVERSFAQLSLRAKQPGGSKTPQTPKRTAPTPEAITPSTDLSPLNIVQQCLGTLNALANDNPRVPSFFLNEHETITGQSMKSSKKGKGRESRAAKFPLNALLTLLDRKLITENPAVMETLASLLSHVTHPLTILIRRSREAQEAGEPKDPVISTRAPAQTAGADDVMQGVTAETTADDPAGESATSQPSRSAEQQPQPQEKPNDAKKKHRDLAPPEVPEENLGLVVNILAARECANKTFIDTLDIIKNLSAIPGSKEVFGKELIRQAQELGQTLLADLEELAKQINAAHTGTDIQGMALASFSSASAKQKKLLRVLVALDHLFDPKRTPQTPVVINNPGGEQKLKEDILATLYGSSTFEQLWVSLSSCLTAIRQRGNMINVATILLPLIESLMVVCRNSALKEGSATTVTSPVATSVASPSPETRMNGLFYTFTEEHRKILNELIRNNSKLMNGNLAVLAKNSKVLEFDNKRSYFTRKVHDRRSEARVSHPSLQLNVRRNHVFLDSFKALYYKSGDEIKYGKLNIRFVGEEGVDAGGVSREWFAAMARQMFNPDYALFNPVAADRTTFHPNSLSEVNPEHLLFFKFIGRIIGKALYENKILECHFSRAVYRKILGKSVSLKDMETLDLDYYRSLVWILENDITDVTFETFSVDVDRFGVTETIDLIPNGRNISVTEENKQEYVRHVVDYRLIKSVQLQLDQFLEGFHEIIPSQLISIFNEQELELLISGLPNIDVDDWKANTDYTNYTPNSPQVQWFWRAVKGFDKEEQAKLLQFVTGTSKVPLNGFKELEGMNGFSKFNIHRDYSSKEKLPSSHTCFNQLDLPEYESYEHLRQQLYIAITAGSEYFGFA